VRATIALTFSGEIAREFDLLRTTFGGGTPERIPPHITLVPPVNCSLAEFDALRAVVIKFALATSPFTITLDGADIFHTAREVVYLRVKDGGVIAEMASQLSRASERPFIPHVTIWQGKSEYRAGALRESLALFERPVEIDRLALLASDSTRWAQETEVMLGYGGRRIRGGVEVVVAQVTTPSRWRLDHAQQLACAAYRDGSLAAEAVARRVNSWVWELEHVQVYDQDLRGRGLGRLVTRELFEVLSDSVFVASQDHELLNGLEKETMSSLAVSALNLDQSKSWKAWSFSSR